MATESSPRDRRPARACRRRSLALPLLLASVWPLSAGCGDGEGPPPGGRRKIEVKALPRPILDAASKALPGIKFEDAWENLDRDRKLQSYEIRGRNPANGKIREARVSLSGEILESE